MKKFITLSIIASTLVSSATSFSMLRTLRTQKRPHARMYRVTRTIGERPPRNIHYSSPDEISANAKILLEDMSQRNQELTELLQKQIERNQKLLDYIKQQNSIASNYISNGESLNIIQLKELEINIRQRIRNEYGIHGLHHFEYEVREFGKEHIYDH